MKSLLLAAAALVALAAGSAQATPIVGTNNVLALETTSSLVHLTLGDILTNSIVMFGGSQSGDFAGPLIPGTTMTDTSLTATNGASYSWTSSVGSFVGTVSGSPVLTVNNPMSRDLSVFVLGTFTPAGSLAGFTAGPMSETISYTETDTVLGGESFSFSATIASPPVDPPAVPEPMSLAIFGLGLAGLARVRHNRA